MKYLFLHLGLLLAITAKGQFQLNGVATNLGGGVYQLTPALNSQFGAVWSKVQHDLNNPFNVQGQMNFGSDPGGADGIAFVMQNSCLAAGGGGGGIGFSGIPGQSLGVEFDTYQNISGTGVELNNDPVYDHIAVEKMGDVVHDASANDLTAPVQMDPVLTNVKTGAWYDFKISYNPATKLLQVYFNGSLRVSIVYDIKTNIFSGSQYVYWGFTSTTGGHNNIQQVSINSSLSTHVLGDTTICTGSIPVVLPLLSSLKGTNLALNNPATASTTNGVGTPASAAVDGNMGSRWESIQNVDPQWIYVDLQSPTDIDSVVIYWEAARAKDYQLQTSADASSWTTVFSTTTGSGSKDKIVFSATNVRYVRMYGTARLIGYGYSIWEFQVYGQPKYLWSTNNGTNTTISPDVYSSSVSLTPTVTTTYSVLIPDPCMGFTSASMTVTISCTNPVELIGFSGKAENKGIQLQWTTASEYNTSYFEILRSEDGIHFEVIGYVTAGNQGNTILNYSYFDDDVSSGGFYYKLAMVDFDGYREESEVKFVSIDSRDVFIPNPVFEDETSLILRGNISQIQYSVVDMLGRDVFASSLSDPPPVIYVGQDLAPACYLIRIKADSFVGTLKICKVK